jgi:hypothetical protein
MTLPCRDQDDSCPRPEPCRLRLEAERGLRQWDWLEEKGCGELIARREGFMSVEDYVKKQEAESDG